MKQGEDIGLKFGDYVDIEMLRYGVENEVYQHKVIGVLKSNTWVDVPVQSPAKETVHSEMDWVVACVCCGVSERDILRYRISDVRKKEEKQKVLIDPDELTREVEKVVFDTGFSVNLENGWAILKTDLLKVIERLKGE